MNLYNWFDPRFATLPVASKVRRFEGYFLRHVSSLKQLRTSGARCTELNQHALISGRCRDVARLYVNDADAKACTHLQLKLDGVYTPQSVHHAENGAQEHRI
jgi:hypothetical protein